MIRSGALLLYAFLFVPIVRNSPQDGDAAGLQNFLFLKKKRGGLVSCGIWYYSEFIVILSNLDSKIGAITHYKPASRKTH